MSDHRYGVVIPHVGKPSLLRGCLSALFRAHPKEELAVVVMEQHGEYGRVMLQKEFADDMGAGIIVWAKSEPEWSFSKINNEGVKLLPQECDLLLLLNNDTVPKKNFLAEMAKALDEHPDVGVVGAKLIHPGGTIQHIGVCINGYFPPYHYGHGHEDTVTFAPANRDDYVDAVTFACALTRRSLWDQLGGLDELFDFNYEDADFCWRAAEAGLLSYFAHQAVVLHIENASVHHRRPNTGPKAQFAVLHARWLDSGRLWKVFPHRKPPVRPETFANEHVVTFCEAARWSGVAYWRLALPCRQASKQKLFRALTSFIMRDDTELSTDQLTASDLVVACVGGTPSQPMLNWVKDPRRGFAIALDCDDHPLHISPFAGAYRFYGTKEVKIRDEAVGETWFWKDGENEFDIERNITYRQRALDAISSVELVTTSVPPLYEYLKTLNRNVALVPNSIDFNVWGPLGDLWQRKPGPIRIGWFGGDNHYHDMVTIGPALTEYVNTHDVQLVIYGTYYKGAFRGLDESKLVKEEWVDVEAHPYKLARLGIDVGLVPLAHEGQPMMEFNRYKSNIKFLEFAALRIPTLVVAGVTPYATCSDGENCLTYASTEEFTEKLDRLCKDKDLRLEIGDLGYDYVRQHFDMEKNIHRWARAYVDVVDRFRGTARSAAVAEGAPA